MAEKYLVSIGKWVFACCGFRKAYNGSLRSSDSDYSAHFSFGSDTEPEPLSSQTANLHNQPSNADEDHANTKLGPLEAPCRDHSTETLQELERSQHLAYQALA